VLHEGLVEADRYGVAQMVLHGKEQVVLVRPVDGLLAITPLN
jgi:non-homologous end joining protein Ku